MFLPLIFNCLFRWIGFFFNVSRLVGLNENKPCLCPPAAAPPTSNLESGNKCLPCKQARRPLQLFRARTRMSACGKRQTLPSRTRLMFDLHQLKQLQGSWATGLFCREEEECEHKLISVRQRWCFLQHRSMKRARVALHAHVSRLLFVEVRSGVEGQMGTRRSRSSAVLLCDTIEASRCSWILLLLLLGATRRWNQMSDLREAMWDL